LNAEDIAEEVEGMWKSLYKLSKTLQDTPGAKRIAETVRAKVEKFRQYIPVLNTICNPGLQARHWEKVRRVLGESRRFELLHSTVELKKVPPLS